MAGKNVTLKRTVRIDNKRRNPGEKLQVSAELYAELEAADAIELEAKADAKEQDDNKKGK